MIRVTRTLRNERSMAAIEKAKVAYSLTRYVLENLSTIGIEYSVYYDTKLLVAMCNLVSRNKDTNRL